MEIVGDSQIYWVVMFLEKQLLLALFMKIFPNSVNVFDKVLVDKVTDCKVLGKHYFKEMIYAS